MVRGEEVLEVARLQTPRQAHLRGGHFLISEVTLYSGVTLNVARPDMKNYTTLGVMLY